MIKFKELEIPGATEEESAGFLNRLDAILKSWEGTPYMYGQQARGKGADCCTFASAVVDELRGEKTKVHKVPFGAWLLGEDNGVAELRKTAEASGLCRVSVDCGIEPGDVAVASYVHGGPHHLFVVGVSGSLWAATEAGVARVGLTDMDTPLFKVRYVFRLQERK